MELNDGTIIPSYFGVVNTVTNPESSEVYGNVALRMGQVVDIIYPSDIRSVSGKFIEYLVETQYRDDAGRSVSTKMLCYAGSLFGGRADYIRTTYRKRVSDQTEDGSGLGSKVLLLCINGDKNNAVIIGGVRDGTQMQGVQDPAKDADLGHHHEWQFNGLKQTINKDGEYSILFRGATKEDDSLLGDKKASGTTLLFDKKGSIFLKHEAESLNLDYPGQHWNLNATNNINLTAGKGVLVGGSDASDAMLMGTTFRTDQQTLHQNLMIGLTSLVALISAAGAGLTAAAGFLPTPVIGAINAAAPIGAAGAGLTSAVPLITKMVSDITTFETSASVNHLSRKHKVGY